MKDKELKKKSSKGTRRKERMEGRKSPCHHSIENITTL
jgi:hypothetical protein